MFGRLPWFALERRRRALRFLVFFDIATQPTVCDLVKLLVGIVRCASSKTEEGQHDMTMTTTRTVGAEAL